MPKRRALSAKEVDAITKNGLTWVDDNLYLQVRPDGTRSWIFRYERNGKVRSMGLGPCSRVSLTDARRMAGEHRVALWNGADPVAEKCVGQRLEPRGVPPPAAPIPVVEGDGCSGGRERPPPQHGGGTNGP